LKTNAHLFSDAFALNIGPEDWQFAQARSAYRICSDRSPSEGMDKKSTLKLFLSLDMNVLPSVTREDMTKLVDMVEELGRLDCQLVVNRRHASKAIWDEDVAEKTGKIVLSTFGGGEAGFGGAGWPGFLRECKRRDLNVST
jgi:glucan endo-1,3-alpha-glucosidase